MSQTATEALPAPAVHRPSRVGVAGMWTFLATDAMGFAGLLVAYGVLRVRADAWPDPRAHLGLGLAAAMTFALLASAFTMTQAARATAARARLGWLVATAGLGLAFLAAEVAEYRRLWTAADPVRISSGLSAGQPRFTSSGYHGLHVAAGSCPCSPSRSGARGLGPSRWWRSTGTSSIWPGWRSSRSST